MSSSNKAQFSMIYLTFVGWYRLQLENRWHRNHHVNQVTMTTVAMVTYWGDTR